MVEAQFDKIEKEVKQEVQAKINRSTSKIGGQNVAKNANAGVKKILTKAEKFRKEEERKNPTDISKGNTRELTPSVKTVSFKEMIDEQKENVPSEVKFEVLEKKFSSTIQPLVVNKTKHQQQNMGVFEMKQQQSESFQSVKRKPCLSSHILPSVDIRPSLVIENIPGLYFLGNQKKPNQKIKVEHVIENEDDSNVDHVEELSVTDSTTSKFEKLEKLVATPQDTPRTKDQIRYLC